MFKEHIEDSKIHQFISTMDPFRINFVSMMNLSALLHGFIWFEKGTRKAELRMLVKHRDNIREKEAANASSPTPGTPGTAALTASVVPLALFTDAELNQFDRWNKAKGSSVGVSIASRLIFGALYELQSSLKSKTLTVDNVITIFCSVCITQSCEIQLARVIKPALAYVMKLRQRKMDDYQSKYDENGNHDNALTMTDFLEETKLIANNLFTVQQVMQIVEDDIHDISSILADQFDEACKLCGILPNL